MNSKTTTKLARHIVHFHYHGFGGEFEKFRITANYLGLDLRDEEIQYAINHIFHNNEKVFEDYLQEGVKTKIVLYALRSFVANCNEYIKEYAGGDVTNYEMQVKAAEAFIPIGLHHLASKEVFPHTLLNEKITLVVSLIVAVITIIYLFIIN